MKKVILFLAVCFGVFVCQDVAAQSQNLQSTQIVKQAVTPSNGSTNTNSLTVSPNSGTITKQAQQTQLQSTSGTGSTTGNIQSLQTVSSGILKNATPVQLNAANSSNSAVSSSRVQQIREKNPTDATPLGGN